MIYITGDTHIPVDVSKLNMKRFPQQKGLSAGDYVIICGDFGGVWDGSHEEMYWRRWFDRKAFTTLFIDGNHENHQMLNEAFPVVQFCKGKAHQISDRIYHLMRGEVFLMDGRKIFVLGGASSHDRESRIAGRNWWPQELPSAQEYRRAMDNLEAHEWKVDYIVTHCAPDSVQRRIKTGYEENELTQFLEGIKSKASFEKWYFGHYHTDMEFDGRYVCLFERVIAAGQ